MKCSCADVPALKELDALRTELFDAGLIGMRQDGIGYGNISLRTEKGFVISATATGGIRELGADGYSLVTEWSLAGNRLSCSGAASGQFRSADACRRV